MASRHSNLFFLLFILFLFFMNLFIISLRFLIIPAEEPQITPLPQTLQAKAPFVLKTFTDAGDFADWEPVDADWDTYDESGATLIAILEADGAAEDASCRRVIPDIDTDLMPCLDVWGSVSVDGTGLSQPSVDYEFHLWVEYNDTSTDTLKYSAGTCLKDQTVDFWIDVDQFAFDADLEVSYLWVEAWIGAVPIGSADISVYIEYETYYANYLPKPENLKSYPVNYKVIGEPVTFTCDINDTHRVDTCMAQFVYAPNGNSETQNMTVDWTVEDFYYTNYTFTREGVYLWKVYVVMDFWGVTNDCPLEYISVGDGTYPADAKLTIWEPSGLSVPTNVKVYLGDSETYEVFMPQININPTWTHYAANSSTRYVEYYVEDNKLHLNAIRNGAKINCSDEDGLYPNISHYESLVFDVRVSSINTTTLQYIVIGINSLQADYYLPFDVTYLNTWVQYIVPFPQFTWRVYSDALAELLFYGHLTAEFKNVYVADYKNISTVLTDATNSTYEFEQSTTDYNSSTYVYTGNTTQTALPSFNNYTAWFNQTYSLTCGTSNSSQSDSNSSTFESGSNPAETFHETNFNITNFESNHIYIDSNETIQLNLTGVYSADYSFTDDIVGADPSGWSINEGTSCTVQVLADLDGHDKIVEFYDDNAGAVAGIYQSSGFDESSGTIEFWYRYHLGTGGDLFALSTYDTGVGKYGFEVYFNYPSDNQIWDGSKIADIVEDTWYHLRVIFDCSSDTYEIYLDGVKQGTTWSFDNDIDGVDYLRFQTSGANTNSDHYSYVDAIDFSWSDGYFLNRNFNNTYYGIEEFHYFGEYSFTDNTIGDSPDGWTVTEAASTSINVIPSIGGHFDAVEFIDDNNGDNCEMYNEFSSQEYGTIEFWWMGISLDEGTNEKAFIWIYDGVSIVMYLLLTYDVPSQLWTLRTLNGGYITHKSDMNNGTWYHFRIEFECGTGGHDGLSEDYYNIYVNGVKENAAEIEFLNTADGIDKFYVESRMGTQPEEYRFYFDAIDFSWSSGYYLNRNNVCWSEPYYLSPIYDLGAANNSYYYETLSFSRILGAENTNLTLKYRSSTDNSTWDSWSNTFISNQTIYASKGRYFQFSVNVTSWGNLTYTSQCGWVNLTYNEAHELNGSVSFEFSYIYETHIYNISLSATFNATDLTIGFYDFDALTWNYSTYNSPLTIPLNTAYLNTTHILLRLNYTDYPSFAVAFSANINITYYTYTNTSNIYYYALTDTNFYYFYNFTLNYSTPSQTSINFEWRSSADNITFSEWSETLGVYSQQNRYISYRINCSSLTGWNASFFYGADLFLQYQNITAYYVLLNLSKAFIPPHYFLRNVTLFVTTLLNVSSGAVLNSSLSVYDFSGSSWTNKTAIPSTYSENLTSDYYNATYHVNISLNAFTNRTTPFTMNISRCELIVSGWDFDKVCYITHNITSYGFNSSTNITIYHTSFNTTPYSYSGSYIQLWFKFQNGTEYMYSQNTMGDNLTYTLYLDYIPDIELFKWKYIFNAEYQDYNISAYIWKLMFVGYLSYRLISDANRQSSDIITFNEDYQCLAMTDYYGTLVYKQFINRTTNGYYVDVMLNFWEVTFSNYIPDTVITWNLTNRDLNISITCPYGISITIKLFTDDYVIVSYNEETKVVIDTWDHVISKTQNRQYTYTYEVPTTPPNQNVGWGGIESGDLMLYAIIIGGFFVIFVLVRRNNPDLNKLLKQLEKPSKPKPKKKPPKKKNSPNKITRTGDIYA